MQAQLKQSWSFTVHSVLGCYHKSCF